MQTASAPHILRLCRRRPFWEGVWDQFRAWERIGAQGCVLLARWRVQSAPRSAPRRPRVPKVIPKAHFWGAWPPLFEAEVPQCCMYEKHTIYHVFTTLDGSGLPVFSTRPAFAT